MTKRDFDKILKRNKEYQLEVLLPANIWYPYEKTQSFLIEDYIKYNQYNKFRIKKEQSKFNIIKQFFL